MTYMPDRGDLVIIEFSPQAGHEQAGRRPAIVLSRKSFNQVTGFVSVCPITSKEKGFGFEVKIPSGLNVSGVVLTHHLKNLDMRARGIKKVDTAPTELIQEVTDYVLTFIQ